MKATFQLLDCDYILVNNSPKIRLFGKTEEGKTICCFYEGHMPYFYVLPKKNSERKVVEFLKENFSRLVVNVSEVEKFLPIGFSRKKKKMLKVTLNNPSKTPDIRETLLKENFVEDVFEADILFKYRFMADFNLSGMRWYLVSGKATHTNTVKTDIKMSIESIKPVEDKESKLKYMALDIETTGGEGPPDPKKDKIAIISLAFFPKFRGKDSLVLVSKPLKKAENGVIAFRDEKSMLEEFLKIIDSFDCDIITGYNLNDFDIPFINTRMIENKISRTIGRCNQKSLTSRKFGFRTRNRVPGRIVADVYELVKESIGKGLLRLKRYGLGDVAKELLGEGKVDIAHSEITKFWNGTEPQVKKLIEYAKKDAELALKLLLKKNMLDKFIELAKVSGLLLQDVLDGGEAVRVENLLLREFDKEDYVLPLKPSSEELLKRKDERITKGLKGALVLEPVVGLHTSCTIYLDFKAMYPSIFIAYNICPTTLLLNGNEECIETPYGTKFVVKKIREGIVPRILKFLVSERDKVKAQMRKVKGEERRVLNAKQYALKIMANAFYGYTGYIRARLYLLDIANAITSCGRFLIQKTKEIVESDPNFKVVFGDTDSVAIKTQTVDLEEAFKLGKKMEEKINREMGGTIKMKIESVFKSLLVLTKKRYAGLAFEKLNGNYTEKIVMKGIETVRRDWCDLTGEALFNVIEIILKEQKPEKALKYVKGILSELEKGKIPVEKLVITKGITKSLSSYKGIQPHVELAKKLRKRSPAEAPGVGDRVSFVIVQGPQLLSKRAETPEYVKEHGLKIDSKYYVESQILPPLERVFEAVGIKKTDLLGIGKQMVLTEAIKNKTKKSGEALTDLDGFICNKCSQTYRRPPLIGKCQNCGGEILFYSGQKRSRYWAP